MITQINKLKRFGIYQNYTWGTIDDFKKKNLVYGWNYSGKTTLSKLFQVLEFKDKTDVLAVRKSKSPQMTGQQSKHMIKTQ